MTDMRKVLEEARAFIVATVPGAEYSILPRIDAALSEPAPGGEPVAWTRDDLAIGLAALDNIVLHEVRSTVGPAEDANNWRTYLGKADDLLAHLSLYRHPEAGEREGVPQNIVDALMAYDAAHQAYLTRCWLDEGDGDYATSASLEQRLRSAIMSWANRRVNELAHERDSRALRRPAATRQAGGTS